MFATAVFGLIGYVLIKLGLEPAPMLLGFVLGKLMEEKLRQALALSEGSFMTFVERPVAAGLLACALAIMMGHMGTHGAAPALYANLKYDPIKDFEPLGLVAGTPILMVAKKDFPAANLKEFITRIKDPSAKAKQAHAGVGSVSYTTCTLLTSQLNAKNIVVAYRGTGPALNDLVGGQVDYMCDQIVNLVEQVKSGNIKALAIATPERSHALPNVPTTTEGGLPEYQVSAWNALFAPRGVPKDISTRLNDALVKGLDEEATRKRLLDLGSVIPDKAGRSPQALADLVSSEIKRWGAILKPSPVAQ